MLTLSRRWSRKIIMPWYLVELNVGISDKLAEYIRTTYGNNNQNIPVFERKGNYTKIIAFAPSVAAINNALLDIRTRIAEVEEIQYTPATGFIETPPKT